jgi:hypothetical protein
MDHDCLELRMKAAPDRPWLQEDLEWAQALDSVESVVIVGDTLAITTATCSVDVAKQLAQLIAMHFEGVAVEWACKHDPNHASLL